MRFEAGRVRHNIELLDQYGPVHIQLRATRRSRCSAPATLSFGSAPTDRTFGNAVGQCVVCNLDAYGFLKDVTLHPFPYGTCRGDIQGFFIIAQRIAMGLFEFNSLRTAHSNILAL